MKIVTSGLTFLDIDAYGGIVAYAELLNKLGEEAVAYSSATMNESITSTIRSWEVPLSSSYQSSRDDRFILIDVSDPEYLDKAVDVDRVVEVIDHHVGHEQFWKEKGVDTNIEFIGAACTQVYEAWQKAGIADGISVSSARLLVSGILDNTLNFEAGVTTQRDRVACTALLEKANLPDDWTETYFRECEASILADVATSLINDTKFIRIKQSPAGQLAFGRMVIWNADAVVKSHRKAIESTMNHQSVNWFVNIVSIADGKNYLLASDDVVKNWAANLLGTEFDDGIAETDRLWLRKEIIKKDLERSQ